MKRTAISTTSRTGWLQHAIALGAAVHSVGVGRRLGPRRDARVEQEHVRRSLLTRIAATDFGHAKSISAGLTYAEFRDRVALRPYEEFVPWIERMKLGEPDVLWPGRCSYFAVSSGTTQGRTKYLPVTKDLLRHFNRTGLDSLGLYARRVGSTGVFRGRHLFLGGATGLTLCSGTSARRAWSGDLSGITARHLPRWVDRHLYEPGREIARIADWPRKLEAMAARTAGRDIRLIAGIPSWLLILAETVRAQTGRSTMNEVWPHLECLVHGGVPLAPFAAELRASFGAQVNFHEVFPASEGFLAAQDAEPEAGLRLFTNADIFFEFLPLAKFDETRLEQLGPHCVPLADVVTGVDYVLMLTTPSGLCRYVIGDVVRFTSLRPPRIVYVGRTRLQLSAFGEHVLEKELTDALTTVWTRHGLSVENFHVAPYFVDRELGRARGGHEWWIESRSARDTLVDPVRLAGELDRELQRLNEDYEAKRLGGGLDLPHVRLAPAKTFEAWLRRKGRWGGQSKMPRCRSDRAIADELAASVREVTTAVGGSDE